MSKIIMNILLKLDLNNYEGLVECCKNYTS